MKKLLVFVGIIAILFSSSAVYSSKNEGTGSQEADQNNEVVETQEQQKILVSPSPTGSMVQNENEIKTQNQGEDSQLKVENQEEEKLGENEDSLDKSKDESPRSDTAKANMSDVAKKVEELLTTESTQGGIGEQVKQVAQEQKEAQEGIKTELGKIDDRSKLLKSLIGPNYQALKNMQKQMEQNQSRIKELEQLMSKLTNQSEITMVQETIKALTDQNVSLQDRITLEEQSRSLLGWLFKLFAK